VSQYVVEHLGDAALLNALSTLVAQDRATTAALLAHLAEVDARKLYLPAGHASMHAYCTEALRMSESAAFKRIQAARVARAFPALFAAVADGRLHLTAVCMLSAHLTPGNLEELLAAATHARRADLAAWLAEQFAPAPVALPLEACAQLAPERVETCAQAAPEPPVASVLPAPPAAWPVAPARSTLHLAITRRTREKLARARELLGHEVASGDLGAVIDRALDALIT